MGKPDCDGYKFFTFGFCTIQAILDTSIIKFMDRSYRSNMVPNVAIGVFPQPLSFSMSKYHLKMVISFITLSFMPFFSIVPVTLVQEKEKRIKEAMHLMGMKTLPYWLAWTFVEIMLSVIPCLLTTFVFVILDLTIFMNPLYLYIMLQLYSLSLILIGFIVSVPFRTTKVASIVSSLTGFSIPWLFYGLEMMAIPFEIERLLSIFSPLAFAYTIKYSMLTIENIPWYSFSQYSLGFGITMIIIDIGLYLSTLILSDVFLTNRETFLYNLIRLFKTPVRSEKLKEQQRKQAPTVVDIESIDEDLLDKNLIKVMNVTKIYDKLSIAVNDLSMDIYESQITALLGQNGAGKTTLINMIIGSLQPSFGHITICNLNVNNVFDIADLRTRFGICFQEDIIFDELTPLEHLRFFGRIKGASGIRLEQEIRFLLTQTDLMAKMHHNAGILSGGQKRKLCTAIALVGGSQIILLDEPTSGVDPYSREKMWSLLRSYKKNRVIMLSTHTMYEADVLADRKAIIVKGSIRCCGSSMFLKNKFGVGYHLRLEIEPKLADIDYVEKIITEKIYESRLDRQTQNELLFTLPKSETQNFPKLFESIDKMIRDNEGILGYGIKLTTLEDVFLKICYESDEILMEQMNAAKSSKNPNVFDFDEINRIKFKQNSFRVMWYFFHVKVRTITRNWQFLISVTIQALVIVCFMLFTSSRLLQQMPTRIVLNSNLYPDRSVLYSGPNIQKELNILSNYLWPVIHVDSMSLTTMVGKHYAITFNDSNDVNHLDFTLLFNKSYQYSLPILQNAMTNMLIQSGHLNYEQGENFERIRTATYPLPDRSNTLEDGLDMLFIVMFGMSLTTFPVNLAAETIKERDMIIHFSIGILLLPYLDRMKRERRTWRSILFCKKRKDPKDEASVQTNPDDEKQMDEDVYEEKSRAKQIIESKFKQDKPLLLIRNLTKDYKIQTAVKRLNLIIESGQIFGLLGPNGAGKTTVMKIIVRDELETSGKLYLEGVSFKDRLAPNVMAYCPQINPFWPEITLIEHLHLYAAIRGIPGNRINEICDKLIKAFGITEYKNRKFRKLSGGNKRKLCLLISILANVKLTMLDEPSTGMDPSSKRLMWNLIIKKFDPNGPNSAILTSHSMEEIEALCTRLAIMAKGSLKCLGNIQHLNNKYGKGYFLEIKWKKGFDFGRIQSEIISIFPDMRINEQNPELIKLIIPQKNVKSLADFFSTMETLVKDNPEIEEYNLNQSSIEQLFIEFAKIHEYINL
ncbi:ABC transporter-like protein [Euroglyphus maynei]|uniref:ABC transporter-like protein n=1 Tax=Euroglyphus maynei TaxID=6958 RepID=A0A1Y3AZP1_EURMA|nr:ABC transporter-like protein [Euroglyphus maynei]